MDVVGDGAKKKGKGGPVTFQLLIQERAYPR
jgi:hypothetical protein